MKASLERRIENLEQSPDVARESRVQAAIDSGDYSHLDEADFEFLENIFREQYGVDLMDRIAAADAKMTLEQQRAWYEGRLDEVPAENLPGLQALAAEMHAIYERHVTEDARRADQRASNS